MMTCPTCRHNNPTGSNYCANCGAELQPAAMIINNPSPIEIGARPLATPQLKALAVTVGLGLATLLAEASLSFLQRRVASMDKPSFSLRERRSKVPKAPAIVAAQKKPGRTITVVSERVIEEKRWGRPMRRIVERFAWHGEERENG
jgi:hypothetical protein